MAAFEGKAPVELPVPQVIVRDRNVYTLYEGPVAVDSAEGRSVSFNSSPFLESANLVIPPLYDPLGRFYCLVYERQRLELHSADSRALLMALEVVDAKQVFFSPQGSFLVTWASPTKQGDTFLPNMKVWDTVTGSMLASYVSKSYRPDMMQWTECEGWAFRQHHSDVYVYGKGLYQPDQTIAKLTHKGYKNFKEQELMNDMKSVLAQARAADMNTLSSSGIADPLGRLLFGGKGGDLVYFHFNSCCSQQQFAKSSSTFYKAGTILQYGRTYVNWSGPFWKAYFPEHLSQGSFGDAEVRVQGKTYVLQIVNDTKAKKTTIIMGPN
ncbi:hypothetical protein EON64_16715 [archaeon]|nr:MAG: hypothetical protein EON64_16715 [archaeon]